MLKQFQPGLSQCLNWICEMPAEHVIQVTAKARDKKSRRVNF